MGSFQQLSGEGMQGTSTDGQPRISAASSLVPDSLVIIL